MTGIKEILLQDKAADLRGMWENERDYTSNRVKGYGVEEAFRSSLRGGDGGVRGRGVTPGLV